MPYFGPRPFHCSQCSWKGKLLHGDVFATNEFGEEIGLYCPVCGSGVKHGLRQESFNPGPTQVEHQNTTQYSTRRRLSTIRKLQNAPAGSWFGVFIIQYWTFILIQIALYDDPKQAPGFIIITPLAITFFLLLVFMLSRLTKACSHFGIVKGIIRGALIFIAWTGGVALFFYLGVSTIMYLDVNIGSVGQIILVIMIPITLTAYSPIMYAVHHILRINKLLYDTPTPDSHSTHVDSNINNFDISDYRSLIKNIKSTQQPMGVNNGRQVPDAKIWGLPLRQIKTEYRTTKLFDYYPCPLQKPSMWY